MRLFSTIALLLVCTLNTWADVLAPGDPESKVVAMLGEPSGKMSLGATTLYKYGNGQVKVKDGTVVEVSGISQTTAKAAPAEKPATPVAVAQPPAQEPAVDTLQIGGAGLSAPNKKAAEWLTHYGEARRLAREEGKRVLMLFTGSDWCIWCKRLEKEILAKAEFKDYAAEQLVLLKLDFPKNTQLAQAQRDQNSQLAEHFKIRGFPTVVVLNPTGQTLGRLGYLQGGPKVFLNELKKLY